MREEEDFFCDFFQILTMEAEKIFVVLRRRGDLDDGDGKAVGGCGEDS